MKTAGDTRMFSLLLSSSHNAKAVSASHSTPPVSELRVHRGTHSWGRGPQLTTGISHTIRHHAQHVNLGEGRGTGRHSERWSLSFKATFRCDGALVFQKWMNTCCPWELVNEFLLTPASYALGTNLSLSHFQFPHFHLS